MWDAQSEFDRRDERETHEEVGRLRNLAMEMIQEMSDETFMAWWEQHQAGMDDAAIQAHNASEARRFQFAAVTRGHEEPVCEEIPF